MLNSFEIIDNEYALINILISSIIVDIDTLEMLKNVIGEVKAIYKKDLSTVRVYFSNVTNNLIPLERLILDNYNNDEVIVFTNGNRLDYRKENLKVVPKEESFQYRKQNKNNSSGYSNIHWNSKHNRWRVVIKGKYFGQFKTIEEAISRRNEVLNLSTR